CRRAGWIGVGPGLAAFRTAGSGGPPPWRPGRITDAPCRLREHLRMPSSPSSTACSPAFARFVAAAERHIDDPHAIADHLSVLLDQDGWLAPDDQRPGTDSYRQHLLH